MKFVFIIQGEGRGHLTQALALRRKLADQGHSVEAVLVGRSKARTIPAFFTEKIGTPLYPFESPNFLPTARNKQTNLWKSISYNLLRLPVYGKSMLHIRRIIREKQPDVVINFYELLTGFTYFFFRPAPAMVCIAHQYLFLHPDFEFPTAGLVSLGLLKFFTRMTAWGATKKLALSFVKMPEVPHRNLFVVPPLLRQEVMDSEPEQGHYLLGYLLNSGFSEEVIAWQKAHPEVNLQVFWDKKGEPEEKKINPNLSFHQINDRKFLDYMKGASAYATTAGFESVCEAMYLNKPILMVPTHVEQECNAYDAMRAGAGIVSSSFELDQLVSLAGKETDNSKFRFWAKQVDWLILREFREDLLQTEKPVFRLTNLLTRTIYRLGKRLSI
ncbi:MAG: glycosyltransferase [Tannerellaceae bacterium]|nr:glycosyltransferase [Tannerellaceae bacterium]